MTMNHLDQLLTEHLDGCIKAEAAYFLSLDVSDIEYNEAVKQRVLPWNSCVRRRNRKHSAAKMVLAAIIIALSLIFTACMTIPEIYAALWRMVIEPHEGHISIRFEEETTSAVTAQAQVPPGEVTEAAPSTATADAAAPSANEIGQWAVASYIPSGFCLVDEVSSDISYFAIYEDPATALQFSLAQTLIDDTDWMLDFEEGDLLIQTQIGQYPAILIEYSQDPGCYSLTWQDGYYSYNLYGYFPSAQEPSLIAESMERRSAPAAQQTATATTSSASPSQIEQIAYIANLPQGWHSERSGNDHVSTITNYFEPSGQLRFALSQLLFSASSRLDSENKNITPTTVLGYPALLIKDTVESNIYTLTWADGIYIYTLYGLFDSVEQLIFFAESVRLS